MVMVPDSAPEKLLQVMLFSTFVFAPAGTADAAMTADVVMTTAAIANEMRRMVPPESLSTRSVVPSRYRQEVHGARVGANTRRGSHRPGHGTPLVWASSA